MLEIKNLAKNFVTSNFCCVKNLSQPFFVECTCTNTLSVNYDC